MWIAFTLALIVGFISFFFSVIVVGKESEISDVEVDVESNLEVIKSNSVEYVEREVIKTVEVEKQIEIVEDVITYSFPFDTTYLGDYTVIGAVSDTLPQKEYPYMRSSESITAFARDDVIPEGTLVWIENVGIRQIQTVYGETDTVYVFFDSQDNATRFGIQELKIYQINE